LGNKKTRLKKACFFTNNFKYNKKNENSELSTLFKACFFDETNYLRPRTYHVAKVGITYIGNC
jgi:hypothetical protein